MNSYWPVAPKAVRRAFWIAVVSACLGSLSIFTSPLVGALTASILFAIATGIRRGKIGAALVAFGLSVLQPVIFLLWSVKTSRMIEGVAAWLVIVIELVCAWFFLRSVLAMRGDTNASRFAWRWAALVLVVAVPWLFVHAYVMPSASMEKTLLVGDHLLVDTAGVHFGWRPARDTVVTFRYPIDPKQIFVKRVAGIPGDHIRIENKRMYRNGVPVEEPYAMHISSYVDSYRDNFPSEPNATLPEPAMMMLRNHVQNGEVVVPDGKYFVLGDNRDDSLDSRYWGFVSESDIIGRPLVIYASNESRSTPTILNTRWNRLLKRL